jgi:threonine aldolase
VERAACSSMRRLQLRKIEGAWKVLSGTTKVPVDTNIVWNDLKAEGIYLARFNEIGQDEGLKLKGERLVVHDHICQNEEDTLSRLTGVI